MKYESSADGESSQRLDSSDAKNEGSFRARQGLGRVELLGGGPEGHTSEK